RWRPQLQRRVLRPKGLNFQVFGLRRLASAEPARYGTTAFARPRNVETEVRLQASVRAERSTGHADENCQRARTAGAGRTCRGRFLPRRRLYLAAPRVPNSSRRARHTG